MHLYTSAYIHIHLCTIVHILIDMYVYNHVHIYMIACIQLYKYIHVHSDWENTLMCNFYIEEEPYDEHYRSP